MDRQEEFRKRLLSTFRQEAADHLQAFIAGLLRLEEQPGSRAATIEAIFREVHSLKGAASVVGQVGITVLCQALESYFSALQKGQAQVQGEAVEVLHLAADHLGRLLAEGGEAAPDDARLRDIIDAVEQCRRGERVSAILAPSPRGEEAAPDRPANVRVSADQVATILWQAEQLVGSKVAGAYLIDELARIRAMVSETRLKTKYRPHSALRHAGGGDGSHQNRVNGAGETQDGPWTSLLRELEPAIAGLERLATHNQRHLARGIDELVDEVRSLSLSPAQTVLDAFPKMVRDLARDLGKQARVQIEGGELELDRRILDHLRDPLLHMLRNAVGHGLEPPEERGGKDPVGLVCISVRPVEGQRVEIAISDDGAGIDVAKVVRNAVALGHISADRLGQMSEHARMELIFLSGMSTRDEADRISGRGLGLSIVQEKVQSLGGTVAVESTPGEGTTFRLHLPLRVATLRGVLVEAGAHLLVVPESGIYRVGRLAVSSLRHAAGRPVAECDGRPIPLLSLAELLQVEPAAPVAASASAMASAGAAKRFLQVLFIGTSEPVMALQVDSIQGEQEFLLKSPQPPLRSIRWFSGMTVIGRGRVIPVLQIAELMRAPARGSEAPLAAPAAFEARDRTLSILIAEDSITSRIFLKNLLESIGHAVTSVGDGEEAWNALRRGPFDLLLTDVEMPSLDGYALTERVRADARLAELPVVLITALDSPEHRKRGMAAGADAYLVKNQFDHEQLLDTITRLVSG